MGACFCRGGPDCCMLVGRIIDYPYQVPQMTGPFKCPDCGVWWVGFEHTCRYIDTKITIRKDTSTDSGQG